MSDQNISADFPFTSKFIEVDGEQIHYIEEGQGDPILFIHGNPASSYVWRNIIPHVSPYGRAIALDLIGFGKSSKPDINYGFKDSYHFLEKFIEKLKLKNVTIVVQDWGSGLGFHYAHLHQDNIKSIIFMEAMHKQISWDRLSKADKIMMKMIRNSLFSWLILGVMNMFVKNMLPDWVERKFTDAEMQAYLEPFPNVKSRKPIYVFPRDVPLNEQPDYSAKAVNDYHQWLTQTSIPKLCFYADPGVLIRIDDATYIEHNFPNISMVNLGKGKHFLQEDYPHTIGAHIAEFYQNLERKAS